MTPSIAHTQQLCDQLRDLLHQLHQAPAVACLNGRDQATLLVGKRAYHELTFRGVSCQVVPEEEPCPSKHS
jgi:hypothetical protein